MRDYVVTSARSDEAYIEYQEKKEEKKIRYLKKHLHDEMSKRQNRKNLLSVLAKESQYWLSNPDYWSNRASYTLIPNNFESQSDYYIKLQEVF